MVARPKGVEDSDAVALQQSHAAASDNTIATSGHRFIVEIPGCVPDGALVVNRLARRPEASAGTIELGGLGDSLLGLIKKAQEVLLGSDVSK